MRKFMSGRGGRSPGRGFVVALALLTGAGAWVAGVGAGAATESESPYSWFDPIIDVQRILRERFVEEPNLSEMQRAAIEAMVESLEDPYTAYVPNEDLAQFNKSLRGEYVSIGASVRMEEGWMTIISPLEGSPAFEAGIMPGDRVVAIDGVSTMDEPLDVSIDRLTGVPGTSVTATVERDGERFDLTLVRRHITPRTVAGFTRVGEGWEWFIDPAKRIGYVRLSQFNAPTADELRGALEEMRRGGEIGGLIVDLRFNPGGLLPAATEIADLFLEEGLIVSTKGRDGTEEEAVYAVPEGTLPGFPLAVILNRQSASASEVVSAALQGNERAVVVGTRSFGKGSVQNVIALPSGVGQLKITERHYYGPNGKVIHRTDDSAEWGVDPDEGFYSPMTDEEAGEMLRIRTTRDVIRSGNGGGSGKGANGRGPASVAGAGAGAGAGAATLAAPPTVPALLPGWVRDDLKDRQLAAALEAVQQKIQTGEWVATGDAAGAENAVAMEEIARIERVRDRLLRELDRVDRRVEALSGLMPEDAAGAERLIPEGIDLSGGEVIVRDRDGKEIARLRVTGPGLERWFVDAPMERADAEDK